MTREDLEENLRLQKLVEKLATGNIQVTDEEVDQYIAQSEQAATENVTTETGQTGDTETTDEERASIRETLLQQKKTEAIQTWIQKVREEADIRYFDPALQPQV